MSYGEYHPTPILLPDNSGLRREFLTRRADDRDAPLRDDEYAQYDSRTLFYDVFRREEAPRQVIAIGPPPVNLAPELRGLHVFRGARALRHRLRWYPLLVVVEIDLDEEVAAAPEQDIALRFAFPSFEAEVRVPPSLQDASSPGTEVPSGTGPIAMMTLQKDNEIAWIEDWCRWHRRLHDVTRFRIYDNGSANLAALEEALRRLGDEMDITLIRWPYPYGPGRSFRNRFAQTGAFNHYRMRFGHRDHWCLSMDVDEYLVTAGPGPLRDRLAVGAREGVVSFLVDSFMVPPHPGQGAVRERRVWRHVWRDRDLRGKGQKCIFVPSAITHSRAHMVWPRHRLLDRLARWPGLYGALSRPWHGSLPKRLVRLHRHATLWARVGKWLLRRALPGIHRVRYHSPDDMFFFHFRGLNTNWRPGPEFSEATEAFDAKRHVEDTRLQTLAMGAELVSGEAGAVGQPS